MKQFAFPLSVKCADDDWSKCAAIFRAIGYDSVYVTPIGNFTDGFENGMIVTSIISDDTYYIDHFNPKLIRDIAAACTNDTWYEMEPVIRHDGSYGYTNDLHRLVSVEYSSHRRPTIAEICAHHGYEIKGRDIVKKVETVSNCDKSYCETARQLDEAKAEIKRLKSENADEFHPTNLPYMFQTKPAEFSEREKKRLLRLAERIEKLIKQPHPADPGNKNQQTNEK